MKRLFAVAFLSLTCLLFPSRMEAGHFGLTGGINFLGIRNLNMESAIGYSAGVTYKFNLPVGFAIQPSLLYHSKASKSEGGQLNADLRVDYLELPVSFQWGPDLLFFRPFLDVSPYLGYGLNHDFNFKEYDVPDSSTAIVKDSWSLVNRLEYGLGLGAGLEVWKFQFVCRYNWNFGSLLSPEGKLNAPALLKKGLGEENFGGVTLSLSLLF